MTLIVGLSDGSVSYLGADRFLGNGTYAYRMATPKVWAGKLPTLNGAPVNYGVGFCGSPRDAQLLQHAVTLPPYEAGSSVDKYLAVDFAKAFRAALKEHGNLKDGEMESALLIAIGGQLRGIEVDFGITHVEPMEMAHGAGMVVALGSLHSTRYTGNSPEQRIDAALRAGQAHNAWVDVPFDIIAIT